MKWTFSKQRENENFLREIPGQSTSVSALVALDQLHQTHQQLFSNKNSVFANGQQPCLNLTNFAQLWGNVTVHSNASNYPDGKFLKNWDSEAWSFEKALNSIGVPFWDLGAKQNVAAFLSVDSVQRCLSLLLASSLVCHYIKLILLLIKHFKCICIFLPLWQDGTLSNFCCPVELSMLKNSTQINFCWQNTFLNIITIHFGKINVPC